MSWHAAGFSTLGADADAGKAAATREQRASEAPIETGSLPTIYRVDPTRCVSLELDRSSNLTTQRPCPSDGLALRLEGSDATREDLMLLADGSPR